MLYLTLNFLTFSQWVQNILLRLVFKICYFLKTFWENEKVEKVKIFYYSICRSLN